MKVRANKQNWWAFGFLRGELFKSQEMLLSDTKHTLSACGWASAYSWPGCSGTRLRRRGHPILTHSFKGYRKSLHTETQTGIPEDASPRPRKSSLRVDLLESLVKGLTAVRNHRSLVLHAREAAARSGGLRGLQRCLLTLKDSFQALGQSSKMCKGFGACSNHQARKDVLLPLAEME